MATLREPMNLAIRLSLKKAFRVFWPFNISETFRN
jgi:hypothetical protein